MKFVRTHWLPKNSDLVTIAVSVLLDEKDSDRGFLAVAAYEDETVKYWHFGEKFWHDAYDFKKDDNTDEIWLGTRIAIRPEDGVTAAAIHRRHGMDINVEPADSRSCLTSLLVLADLPERTSFPTRSWEVDSGITSVSISPSGTDVIAGGADRTLRLWGKCDQVRHAQPEWTQRIQSAIRAVVFTPGAKRGLSAHSDGTVKVWDLGTINRLPSHSVPHLAPIKDVAVVFSKQLVISCAEDGIIKLWDLSSGECKASTKTEHYASIEALALTKNEKDLYSVSKDGSFRRWSVSELAISNLSDYARPLSHTFKIVRPSFYHEIFHVSLFDNDNLALLARYDKRMLVYNITSDEEVFCVEPHEGSPLSALAVSRNSCWIVAGSWNNKLSIFYYDRKGGRVKLCAERFLYGSQSHVRIQCIEFCSESDAKMRVVCGLEDGSIALVDGDIDGSLGLYLLRETIGASIRGIALYENREKAVSVDDNGMLSFSDLKTKSSSSFQVHNGPMRCISIAARGDYAITGAESGSLRLWNLGEVQSKAYDKATFPSRDIDCPRPVREFKGDGPINCVMCAGDRYAVAGGGDGAVHIVELLRRERRP